MSSVSEFERKKAAAEVLQASERPRRDANRAAPGPGGRLTPVTRLI